jgi:RES domain-containing protein
MQDPPAGPVPPLVHPRSSQLAEAIRTARTIGWSGRIIRATSLRYATRRDLITGEGARVYGGRWNPRGVPALYGSLEMATALAEMLAYFHDQGLPETEALPCAWVGFDIQLDQVLDLRQQDIRRCLRVNRGQLVNEPWRELQAQGQEALTQAIGRLGAQAGLQGLLVASARARRGSNLVVLNPRRLETARIEIVKQEQFPAYRRSKRT